MDCKNHVHELRNRIAVAICYAPFREWVWLRMCVRVRVRVYFCVGSLRVSTFNLIIYRRAERSSHLPLPSCHMAPGNCHLPLSTCHLHLATLRLPHAMTCAPFHSFWLPKICFAFKWNFLFNLFATLLSAYFK